MRANPMWSYGVLFLALLKLPAVLAQNPPVEEEIEPAKPVFTLVEAGAEPRVELRYKYAVNVQVSFGLTIDQTAKQTLDGEETPEAAVPAMEFSLRCTTESVTPEGDAKVRCDQLQARPRIDPADEITGEPDPDADDANPLRGRSILAVVSDRGLVTSAGLLEANGTAADDAEGLAFLNRELEVLFAILPEEAIGEGAKWVVEMHSDDEGIFSNERHEYRLLSVKDGEIELEVKFTSIAPEQKWALPELPGQKATLRSLKSTAEGRMTIQLDHVLPVRVNLAGDTEMEVSMNVFGETMVLKQSLVTRIIGQRAESPSDSDSPER